MTTRMHFGPGLSFGAFTPTHRADQVAAALRGYFSPEDLIEQAQQLRKAANRRARQRKDTTHLSNLLRLVDEASRPPTVPVAMRWFTERQGGEVIPCELLDGDQAGQTVTVVPPGVQFRFVDPEKIVDRVWCQPVDDRGDDLGGRLWHIDSAGTAGTYLLPFDAIRTGDARDAQ